MTLLNSISHKIRNLVDGLISLRYKDSLETLPEKPCRKSSIQTIAGILST